MESDTPRAASTEKKEKFGFTHLRAGTEKRTAPLGDPSSRADGIGFVTTEEVGTYFIRSMVKTGSEMPSVYVHKVVKKGIEPPPSFWITRTNGNKDGYGWRLAAPTPQIEVQPDSSKSKLEEKQLDLVL